MKGVGAVVVSCMVFTCALLVAASGLAQQTLSGIAGAVKDPTGNPVAGVTVEAASPALIERVRTVVTDGQGLYKITDLAPGTYSVTFRAAGFVGLKHDALELTAGVTATVNADLKAGNPSETVTVTGAVTTVDTRTASVQQATSSDNLNRLASAQGGTAATVSVTQGVSNSAADVGGASGAYAATGGAGALSSRGKASVKRLFDGLRIENAAGTGNTSYFVNSAIVAQTVVETAGGNAESLSSGGMINNVPKSGSNQFSLGFSGLYTRESWQSDNLDSELQARGLSQVNKVGSIWDYTATLGGPIKKDKLWFFFAPKFWGDRLYAAGVYWNDTQHTPVYTPADGTRGLPLRRADNYEDQVSRAVRVTWQATPKQKFNFFSDAPQRACTCRRASTTSAAEATVGYHFYNALVQTTWSSARTNKLLLEAGVSYTRGSWPEMLQPTVTENDIAINDVGRGFTYNAAPIYNGRVGQDQAGNNGFPGSSWDLPGHGHKNDRMAERFSVSYVTGSHAMKVGLQVEQVWHNSYKWANHDINYTFLNGSPSAVVQYTTPYLEEARVKADMGIYAQDQWTIKRLTLNYGLRYSYFNAFVPVAHVDPTAFVQRTRDYAETPCVPCWHDLDPRVGAAYDLFGNGRTALKVTMGRYVGAQVVTLALANNPLSTSVNSASRPWIDASKDFVPNCDLSPAHFFDPQGTNGECGPLNNINFGNPNPTATRYADDVIHGFGKRDYIWDFSAELNHAINRQIAVNAGYYRNWAKNFTTTDNTALSPADFSPYCVTAPIDSRLPNGGAYPICGLYDVSVAKVRSSALVVKQSSDASGGNQQSTVNDYFGGGINARFAGGKRVGLNFEAGRKVSDQCFTVFDPAQTTYIVSTANAVTGYCHQVIPWLANTQVKANGSYPLPYGFSANVTYQNGAGSQILALWPVPSSVILPSLGRNLALGATQTAAVPLIREGTQYEKRRNQLDFRFSKTVRLTAKARFQANFDIYNVTNNNSVQSINTTYSPPGTANSLWLRPTRVLDPRLFEIGGRLDF